MKLALTLVGFLVGIGAALTPRLFSQTHQVTADQRIHTEETFEFTVVAPPDQVAPLFGADKERAWAPGWNPQFIWPSSAADQAGMVFTVAHGDKNAVWVATSFEPRSGHCQYVYVIPNVVATVITLNWNPRATNTHVTVKYERTALTAAANPLVQKMAANDAKSGPEWQHQIESYFKSQH